VLPLTGPDIGLTQTAVTNSDISMLSKVCESTVFIDVCFYHKSQGGLDALYASAFSTHRNDGDVPNFSPLTVEPGFGDFGRLL